MPIPPPHPGELILHDVMEPLGLSVADAAPLFGVTPETLAAVVACAAPVTLDLANGLASHGHSTVSMWLALQDAYDSTAKSGHRPDFA
ncbi:HigA family addiction module antitoxin [Citrobacter farmeri]|uniref:HigA family addiction module antitoxin n=1 Tax=Citrobacter farmeri TaxID=67824 RepID=UPI002226C604|nr:HigA family addiction module antitoxin [Citrobacter farmeri]MCW2425058.1 addiction module HigA family antidote [Citrobacter farmeri]